MEKETRVFLIPFDLIPDELDEMINEIKAFDDVNKNEWAKRFVELANTLGIVMGVDEFQQRFNHSDDFSGHMDVIFITNKY